MFFDVRDKEKKDNRLGLLRRFFLGGIGSRRKAKVNKGAGGMPRLPEAKKDVVSCDKLRGPAHTG
jgi:hypothetical protein